MENDAKRILKALIYIEDHFQEEMTVEELAQIACYSPFHFQRLFRFIVGENVYQYIKRLRIARAAAKLCYSDQRITDIALDTDYKTPSAFTRAFKQCMGKSPRNYRLLYGEIDMINKKIFELPMIEPDEIKQEKDISIIFIRKTGNYDVSSKAAWDALSTLIRDNLSDEDAAKLRYFSIAWDDPKIVEEEKLRFDACVSEDSRIPVKGKFARKVIPGGKYAVFTHHGKPDTLMETYDRIFFKWLPDSKEDFDSKRMNFLEHVKGVTKIYIPLV